MGIVTNGVASFLVPHKTFARIKDHQPSDQYITSTLEVLVSILYALRWNVGNRTHNLVRLLLVEAPYVKKYKAVFPWPIKNARDIHCDPGQDKQGHHPREGQVHPQNKLGGLGVLWRCRKGDNELLCQGCP